MNDLFAVLNRLDRDEDARESSIFSAGTVTVALTGLALAGAIVADRLGYELTSLGLIAVFFFVPPLYTLYSLLQASRVLLPILGAPTQHVLNQAAKRVALQQEAIARLSRFSRDVRVAAEHALAAEVEGIEARTALIVGVLEKTGMIPAAVALDLGYLQYVKNASRTDLVDWLFYGAFTLYAVAFFALAWKQAVKDRLWLLQRAAERA